MPRAATKRKAPASSTASAEKATKKSKTRRAAPDTASDDEPHAERTVAYPHASSQHVLGDGRRDELHDALLAWYATVHDARTMPWRKPWDDTLSAADRAQRAYEVWVSEIMLQQTQVATVVPYYTRWMERFPTVHQLAGADIEDVNALWKGLGYYSRAARLLEGAKVIVRDYDGTMPSDPAVLEKSVPGIGRYSAGAITSIAYGVCAPVLDGNVHRLLSRVLAVYAPPQAKATLSLLWAAALALVTGSTTPGDVNQALIELVCRL